MAASDYSSYRQWKGWLDNAEFFTLSDDEAKAYKRQFEDSGVGISNIRILELGFGNGSLLRYFSDNGSDIVGIELQPELVAAAKEKGINAFSSIDEVEGKFDLIVAFDVLEHLDIDQLKAFFLMAERLLQVNGKMMFRFPNADSYAGMIAQNGDYTHITALGISKVWQLVDPIGLRIVSFSGAIQYPSRFILDSIRQVSRWAFIKLTGHGHPYFFSANVVVVLVKS